jgi:hypothetical protein
MVFVAALVVTINFAPVPGAGALALGTALVALAAGAGFFLRQRHARSPLYDLHVAGGASSGWRRWAGSSSSGH